MSNVNATYTSDKQVMVVCLKKKMEHVLIRWDLFMNDSSSLYNMIQVSSHMTSLNC
jgi:hypothetical protein